MVVQTCFTALEHDRATDFRPAQAVAYVGGIADHRRTPRRFTALICALLIVGLAAWSVVGAVGGTDVPGPPSPSIGKSPALHWRSKKRSGSPSASSEAGY